MNRDAPQYMLILGLVEHDWPGSNWILSVVNIWQPWIYAKINYCAMTNLVLWTPTTYISDSYIFWFIYFLIHIFSDSYIESDFLDFEQRRVSAVEERSDDQRARGERVGSAARRFRWRAGARVPRGSSLPTDQCFLVIMYRAKRGVVIFQKICFLEIFFKILKMGILKKIFFYK